VKRTKFHVSENIDSFLRTKIILIFSLNSAFIELTAVDYISLFLQMKNLGNWNIFMTTAIICSGKNGRKGRL